MRNPAGNPGVLGPGLAQPGGRLSVQQYEKIAAALLARTPREEAVIRAVARRSRIENRHSVLVVEGAMPFYTEGEARRTTGERMEVYAREAPVLVQSAAGDLLDREEIPPEQITHLVTASCTGFSSPGVDILLQQRLGLSSSVKRSHLGFMGCHGAFNAMALAREVCLADPTAAVLVVCVELCTLHFQARMDRDAVVPNSLFADGAGAVLVVGAEHALHGKARYEISETRSCLIEGTLDLMSWQIGDEGFRMTLDPSVPDVIGRGLSGIVSGWGWPLEDGETAWGIHPGGPRVLERAAGALGLDSPAIAASSAVLRHSGNMSSATILFILRELLAGDPGRVNLLAFGPGLSVEGAVLLRRGESR